MTFRQWPFISPEGGGGILNWVLNKDFFQVSTNTAPDWLLVYK